MLFAKKQKTRFVNDGTKMHIGFEKDFHYNSIQREREILKKLEKNQLFYTEFCFPLICP